MAEPISKSLPIADLRLDLTQGSLFFPDYPTPVDTGLAQPLRALIMLGKLLIGHIPAGDVRVGMPPALANQFGDAIQTEITDRLPDSAEGEAYSANRFGIIRTIIRATLDENGRLAVPIDIMSDSGESFVLEQDGETLKLSSKQFPDAKIEIGPVKSFADFQHSLSDDLLLAASGRSAEKTVIVADDGNEPQVPNTLLVNDRLVPNNIVFPVYRFQRTVMADLETHNKAHHARLGHEPAEAILPIKQSGSNLLVRMIMLLCVLMFCSALVLSLTFVF